MSEKQTPQNQPADVNEHLTTTDAVQLSWDKRAIAALALQQVNEVSLIQKLLNNLE